MTPMIRIFPSFLLMTMLTMVRVCRLTITSRAPMSISTTVSIGLLMGALST